MYMYTVYTHTKYTMYIPTRNMRIHLSNESETTGIHILDSERSE